MPRIRCVLLTGSLLACLTATLVTLLRGGAAGSGFLGGYAGAWALFAAAVVALRGVPARAVVPLVLAGSIAAAVTGLAAEPRTSTDSYRYAWDGRVQAAGLSPYDHAPADKAVEGLRDAWLFPGADVCAAKDRNLAPLGDGGCTRINRPTVHTIYPPVAEGWFLLVHAVSPGHVRHTALQAGGALLSLAVTWLLVRVLRRRGDPRRAAWWGWCPAVPVEAVNNAHIDVLAVLFSVAAVVTVARHRFTGGLLLGAAVAAKLLPLLLVPGVLSGLRRRRPALETLAALGLSVGVLYLPYVLISREPVLGYLTGYAQEEGYDDAAAGRRYALLRLVLPDAWVLPAAALVLLLAAVAVWRHRDDRKPWSGALVTVGVTFLVLTPGYSWYALLLVALVALDGRWEWLGIACAGAVAYLAGAATAPAYGCAAVAVCVGWWARRAAAPASHPRPPLPLPLSPGHSPDPGGAPSARGSW
ncbi:glycosyltransferase 87 family protein [Streptomyces sp. NPDC058195]|uniref:glycosyltransferase 87 family protein n=1 Tax=Streptomyces sp. NPDC058195 TaxID=3346375 RepID=UPI0036EB1442